MRKPTQIDVIEKPNLQTLDEQNAMQTTSGESGDGVGKNSTNDANVNEYNCKQQEQRTIFEHKICHSKDSMRLFVESATCKACFSSHLTIIM